MEIADEPQKNNRSHTDEREEQDDEWRKQGKTYTNPEIGALSEQRRADLSAVFAKIPEASIGVKGAFKAYMSDIRDIQGYLSNDLTTKGVDGIASIARKAITDGASLKESTGPVLAAISTARSELTQSGTTDASK